MKGKSWIDNYFELLLQKKFEEAVVLKNQQLPHRLFKYRQLSQYSLDSLMNNYIWLAGMDSLNDPFESSIIYEKEFTKESFLQPAFPLLFEAKFDYKISLNEIDEIAHAADPYRAYVFICLRKGVLMPGLPEEKVKDLVNVWSVMEHKAKSQLRVCSLSERNDDVLMWSHYGDEHRGVCFEYNFQTEDAARPFLHPVMYADKLHLQHTVHGPYSSHQLIASLTKSKAWKYEKEWRVILFKPESNQFNVQKPAAIFLGARFPLNDPQLKDRLVSYALKERIPLLDMSMDAKGYKMLIERSPLN